MTNVPTPNGISISSFGSAFDGISLGTSETCDDVTFADNVARTLDNYSFIWTNNTNKDLSYILIITGQECGSLPLSSSQNLEQCILVDYLIDDIEVKTNEPAAPICITGNQIESCTGNTSHLVNFQVCWCSKEGSGSRTFRAKIDQNYNGINVVLPSGNFDVNGEATVTIPSAGACTNLSVEINIPAYIEAGTIPLKLRFDEGAGCTICNSGFFISLNNPVNVILTDCPFTCPCAFVNIGVKNSTIYWSSLTESQKNAHCIAVEGTLNFDVEDLNVSGKHFYMQNDASIKINNNTTFTNCYFTGCELLWQGINVVDDLYLNNCVVEDARVGVNRVDDVSVILLNSQFFNNYIGVNLHNGSLDLKDSDYKAYIANCTFSSDGLLQDPELKTYNKIGFAGIKLDYFTEQLGTTAYGNSFSNLGFGIISYIANTTVHASTFENILDVNYYNFNNVPSGRGVLGLGVKDLTRSGSLIIGGIRGNQTSNNNFNNCKIAINCEGELHSTGSIIRSARIGVSHTGTPFKSIFCTNNDIEASNNGIRSYGGGYLETLIADNLIKEIGLSSSSMIGIHLYKSIYGGLAFNSFIRDNEIIGGAKMDKGIFLFNMGGYSTTGNLIYLNRNGAAGIYIAACKSQSIKENIINNSNNKQNTVGLYLSKLEKTLIECNHIDNTAIGLEFSGQNTETDIVTNLMQSSTSVGLHCSGSATVESNRSDNIQYLYGNRWDNVTGVTAIHEGTNTQVQKTLFRTNSDILPIFPVNYSTPNVTNNVEWFKSNFGTEDLPFECMFPSQNLSSTTWLDSHALSAVNYMVYDTMLKQQGHQLVYNYICEHPGLNYSVGLQNFFTNYSSSSEGKINNIMNRLNRELGGSNTMDSAITRLNDSLKNYSNLLNSLQLSLGLNPTQSLINSYKIQSYLLSNKFDSINSQIKILLNDHHNDLQDSLEVYYEQLSLVAPPVNNIPMENAYTALNAYISYLLDPDLDFSNGVMQNLLFVANQCPDYGGKSVYMARALVLHSLPNMHWDDALLCLDTLGNNSIRRNEQQNLLLQDTESLFAVSPNPSNGRINVMASDSFNGTIKIFDMYGNKIMQHDYSPELQLTINNYSGVFFVVWEDNNHQVVHLNRVFILK